MVNTYQAPKRLQWIKTLCLAVLIALFGGAGLGAWTISREGIHPDLAPDIAVVELRIDYMNSWLVYRKSDPATAILIDTGISGNEVQLAERIRSVGVNPTEIDAILVTHGHYDHIGGARKLREMFGIPVIVGVGDKDIAEGADAPVCPTVPYARLLAGEAAPTEEWALTPDHTVGLPVDLSEFTDIPGRITPLPGHTEGSLLIVIGNGAFVGDAVRGKMFGRGPARHFFMCDLEDNDNDLKLIANETAVNAEAIYPGHFSAFPMTSLRDWLDSK
ncbi:MAG: MBL fold metallo-hydrolase [Pseudomonadota bacterium]